MLIFRMDDSVPSFAVFLKKDIPEKCLEIWNTSTGRLERIYHWDTTMPLEPGVWLKLSDDLVIQAMLKKLFLTNIKGRHLQFRVPYIEVDDSNGTYCGYSPMFGPTGHFFRAPFELFKLYWVWITKIPDALDGDGMRIFDRFKRKRNMDDRVEWMIENRGAFEEVRMEELAGVSWIKRVNGMVIGHEEDLYHRSVYYVWNETKGLCTIATSRGLEIGRWVSFYALDLPLYPYVVCLDWRFTRNVWNYPKVYDGSQFEVKFYVPPSNLLGYYRAPKIGCVFDPYGEIGTEMEDSIVTGLIGYDYDETKWMLNEVLDTEPATVGVVCYIDANDPTTILFYSKSFRSPNKTIQLDASIFCHLDASKKPKLGNFYAVLYEDQSDQPYAAIHTDLIHSFKLKGKEKQLLMTKTWVQLIAFHQGFLYGYSDDLGTDVLDNSKRLKKIYRPGLPTEGFKEAYFLLDVVYLDDPRFGPGWYIFAYSKVYKIEDEYNRGLKTSDFGYIAAPNAQNGSNETLNDSSRPSTSRGLTKPMVSTTKKSYSKRMREFPAAEKEENGAENYDGLWDGVDDILGLND